MVYNNVLEAVGHTPMGSSAAHETRKEMRRSL